MPRKSRFWFTHGSDIEAYWVNDRIVAAEFGVDEAEARRLIEAACDRLDEKNGVARFNKKRTEILNKIPAYAKHGEDHAGSFEARAHFEAHGREFIHVGKEMLSAIRTVAADEGLKGGHGLGKSIPSGVEIAPDLKAVLKDL